MHCPLCAANTCHDFWRDRRRQYWHCLHCDLIFVDRSEHLSLEQEKQLYDLHQNASHDPYYLRFLSRLATPMLARLSEPAQGLDFGSGPGPAMDALFTPHGHQLACYDPFYAPDEALLARQYAFVCSSEVVEHFCQPMASWQQLVNLVAPQGLLGVMTKRHWGIDAFAKWHYKNDLSHVAFYSDQTMAWLAQQFNLQLELIGADVVMFQAQ